MTPLGELQKRAELFNSLFPDGVVTIERAQKHKGPPKLLFLYFTDADAYADAAARAAAAAAKRYAAAIRTPAGAKYHQTMLEKFVEVFNQGTGEHREPLSKAKEIV